MNMVVVYLVGVFCDIMMRMILVMRVMGKIVVWIQLCQVGWILMVVLMFVVFMRGSLGMLGLGCLGVFMCLF